GWERGYHSINKVVKKILYYSLAAFLLCATSGATLACGTQPCWRRNSSRCRFGRSREVFVELLGENFSISAEGQERGETGSGGCAGARVRACSHGHRYKWRDQGHVEGLAHLVFGVAEGRGCGNRPSEGVGVTGG